MDLAWAGMVQDMSETYTTSTPNVKHRVFIPDDEDYHLIAILNTGKGKENIKKANGSVNNLWFRENRFEVAAKILHAEFAKTAEKTTISLTSLRALRTLRELIDILFYQYHQAIKQSNHFTPCSV